LYILRLAARHRAGADRGRVEAMRVMHFHDQGVCLNCRAIRTYSTPIAGVLVLSSMCQACGRRTMIGWTGDDLCDVCVTTRRVVLRAEGRRSGEPA
jgi:hypothetical protein